MEGEWWFIKKAYEKGRLYEGEKTAAWDAVNGTVLAKHDLEQVTVVDRAIYVKMKAKRKGLEDCYFIIWTTTPWTIPFNLAIMVNSKVTYVKVKVPCKMGEDIWIIAKDLLSDLEEKVKMKGKMKIVDEFSG